MKTLGIVMMATGLAFGQAPPTAAPKPGTDNLPPLQASYGLLDPSVLTRQGQRKPELGKAPPTPKLADGKPDLTGPWAPNAIGENVNLVGVGDRKSVV